VHDTLPFPLISRTDRQTGSNVQLPYWLISLIW
jgi:hypothetical protein